MAKSNKCLYGMLTLLGKHPNGLSGYDAKKRMQSLVHFHIADSNSQVYPILQRLKMLGWAKSIADKTSGKRKRQVWTLTKKGLTELNEYLKQPAKLSSHSEEILTRITGLIHRPTHEVMTQLENYIKQIEEKEQQTKEWIDNISLFYKDSPSLENVVLNTRFTTHILKAKKQWAKETIKTLKLRH